MVGDEIARHLTWLTSDERRWIAGFRDGLTARLGHRLRDFRIFGSKARGDAHEESDIDVLVLIDDLDPETRESVVELAHSISTWLSPVVEDFDRYHSPRSRATGFYKEMRKESVRL